MIKKFIPKSEFGRNIATLISGTAIAQAIPIAISPILTRLYSPDDFGVFALYMSIAAILSIVASVKYEAAVMLPKKDSDAAHIVVLSIGIAFVFSLFILIVIFLFNSQITQLLQNEKISMWLYFVPLTTFFSGVYQSISFWSNRKKQYKRLAVSRVIQNSTAGGIKLGMGFNGLTKGGLIMGTIAGQGIAAIVLLGMVWKEDKALFSRVKKLKVIALSKKYINFPKYSTPGVFLQTVATSSLPILINIFFNTTVVGLYYFANTIVRAPINLLFSSLAQVYHQKAVVLHAKNNLELLVFTQTIQKKMILFLLPFLIFMFIFSPVFFKVIFGEEWEKAGEYLRYFLPLIFFGSIFIPISSLVHVLGEQKFELYWKVSFFISQISSLYISSLYFDFEISIFIMSIFGSLHYIYINYYLKKIIRSTFMEDKYDI